MSRALLSPFPGCCSCSGARPGMREREGVTMDHDHEKLVRTTVFLEEEVLEALEELADEYASDTGQKWSRGAVIRVALSEFFSRRGKIL